MTIAFLGLGTMGGPMAGHLVAKGFAVKVYNRSPQRAQAWQQRFGGQVADSVAEAVSEAEIVALCLGADEDVRAVVAGEHGVLAQLPPGGLIIDHSTTSAALAREMATLCEQRQVGFLDAPVSGGQAGAENGRLTAMVGGAQQDFDRALPVLESYSACVRLLGPAGSGQLAKMVNQICIAGLLQGLSEGLHFGESAGLDMAAVVEVISAGAAQSWQMNNRANTMLAGKFDFGFAVDWMRKDLKYVLEEASRQQLSLPVTALVDQFYSRVQSQGGGRYDTSSLILALDPAKGRGQSPTEKK